MGFGQGPRSCLGMRFALLEAKMGLAAVVRQFELSVTIVQFKLLFTIFYLQIYSSSCFQV